MLVFDQLSHYGDFVFNGGMYQSIYDNWDGEGYDFDMHIVGEEINDPDNASFIYQQYLLKRQN